MFFSPRGQDERQYKQPGQQHARDKRKRRMQRVCLKMAASFCPPVYRGVHGSLLPADSIIYPQKGRVPALNQKARQIGLFGQDTKFAIQSIRKNKE